MFFQPPSSHTEAQVVLKTKVHNFPRRENPPWVDECMPGIKLDDNYAKYTVKCVSFRSYMLYVFFFFRKIYMHHYRLR